MTFQTGQKKWDGGSIKDIMNTWYPTIIFENSLLIKDIGVFWRVYLQTSLEKNLFKLSIKLLTITLDISNYIYKMLSQNWKYFFQKTTFKFTPSDLFSETQRKLEKSFECGTFGKRCTTREISAIAIILNEKS